MGATHIGAQAVITVSESLQSLVPVQEVGVRHGFEGWQEHDGGIFGGRRSKLGEGHPESESESKLKNSGKDPPFTNTRDWKKLTALSVHTDHSRFPYLPCINCKSLF